MICGKCKWYTMFKLEPRCTKTGKPTGYLQEKDCFEPILTYSNLDIMEEKKSVQTKVCKKCGRELPVDQFGKHARTKDGLQPLCKDCRSAAVKGKTLHKHTPDDRPVLKPDNVITLAQATDAELCHELAQRGWTGELSRIEKRRISLEDL